VPFCTTSTRLTAAEEGRNMLPALSSLTIQYQWPEQFSDVCLVNPLLDYRPIQISPASILGCSDVSLSVRPRECVARKLELDEMFLKMTHKWVLGSAMQMLSNLEPRFRHQT
jgi:hypothetical protein